MWLLYYLWYRTFFSRSNNTSVETSPCFSVSFDESLNKVFQVEQIDLNITVLSRGWPKLITLHELEGVWSSQSSLRRRKVVNITKLGKLWAPCSSWWLPNWSKANLTVKLRRFSEPCGKLSMTVLLDGRCTPELEKLMYSPDVFPLR